MQARVNPARAGRLWVREGWRLFRLQPAGFIVLLFVYVVGLSFANMVAELLGHGVAAVIPGLPPDAIGSIGGMFIATLVPGLSVGFMEACRAAEQKKPLRPQMLLQAFMIDKTTSRALLILGAVYAITLGAILAVVFNLDIPVITPGKDGTPPTLPPGAALDFVLSLGGAMLAYLPVAMVLWYAPVLVAWHRMTAAKAMFFSLAACWRNRAAFTIYSLVWGLYFLAIPVIAALLRLANLGSVSVVILMPAAVILVAGIYCSIYASYTGVLITDDATES